MSANPMTAEHEKAGVLPEDVKMRAATAILSASKILPPNATDQLFAGVIDAILADRASRSSPSAIEGGSSGLTRGWVEDLISREWRHDMSPGAAAREVCRSLGASGNSPMLKRLLEAMLSDANRQHNDRNRILSDFAEADPDAAAIARMASFRRLNDGRQEDKFDA